MSIDMRKLWECDHFSIVREMETGYNFVDEKDVVIVLPYEKKGNNYRFLVRREYVPPYFDKLPMSSSVDDKLFHTALCGTIKDKECPEACVLRELKEEAGITPVDGKYDLRFLKKLPVCKVTNMVARLYLMRLDEYTQVEPSGDGSEYEKRSHSAWLSVDELEKVTDGDRVDLILMTMCMAFFVNGIGGFQQ